MPVNVADILRILREKDTLISDEQERLERAILQIGSGFLNALVALIESGEIFAESLLDLVDQFGYSDAVLDGFSAAISLFNKSEDLSIAMGLNVLLSEQIQAELAAFAEAYEQKLLRLFREEIADDMYVFAVESKIAGRSSREIERLARERLEPIGRRAATEVGTALSAFDRATMGMHYAEAGIERFVYWGPRDEVTRETCRAALSNGKQKTGWTRADIDADPGVDFILGGKPYYNCRHEWMPFEVFEGGTA